MTTPLPPPTADGSVGAATVDAIEAAFLALQDEICAFLQRSGRQPMQETPWQHTTGAGGGRTRVLCATQPGQLYEKGACNFSGVGGASMPASATAALSIPADTPYRATGISLILHPSNPWVPTVHMNVRFFSCGSKWWFGGGIDVTPFYPRLGQVVEFHGLMQALCERNGMSYATLKAECDKYFYLPHRLETRGVGGIFFEHLNTDLQRNFEFVLDVGRTFIKAYSIFLENQYFPYTRAQRDFQLYRRGRYVEFNLIYDRGTQFGLKSGGRIESVLVSLPPLATWLYDYTPAPGSWEAYLYAHFLRPRDWLQLTSEDRRAMVPPPGYATGKGTEPHTQPLQPWYKTETARLLGAAVGGVLAGAAATSAWLSGKKKK